LRIQPNDGYTGSLPRHAAALLPSSGRPAAGQERDPRNGRFRARPIFPGPSFLAHQRHEGTGQGIRLFSIRCSLISWPMLEQCSSLDEMRVPEGNILIALDRTEFQCSDKSHRHTCSHFKRGQRQDRVFPYHVGRHGGGAQASSCRAREPAFVVPKDGHDKQDCESCPVRR
jgi:hypothetical protein